MSAPQSRKRRGRTRLALGRRGQPRDRDGRRRRGGGCRVAGGRVARWRHRFDRKPVGLGALLPQRKLEHLDAPQQVIADILIALALALERRNTRLHLRLFNDPLIPLALKPLPFLLQKVQHTGQIIHRLGCRWLHAAPVHLAAIMQPHTAPLFFPPTGGRQGV